MLSEDTGVIAVDVLQYNLNCFVKSGITANNLLNCMFSMLLVKTEKTLGFHSNKQQNIFEYLLL